MGVMKLGFMLKSLKPKVAWPQTRWCNLCRYISALENIQHLRQASDENEMMTGELLFRFYCYRGED